MTHLRNNHGENCHLNPKKENKMEGQHIFYQPLKTYEEFLEWYKKQSIGSWMMMENVTCNQMGTARKQKNLLPVNRCTTKEIYEHWYLLRHSGISKESQI